MADTTPIRYQIFLSSTFTDLQSERVAVTQGLLRMQRCVPAGMELFPASSLPPWEVIRPILELTDYLVLLVGDRYGSVTEDGLGYTEREYDYAFDLGIPVLPFIRETAADVSETNRDASPTAVSRLELFKEKVRSRHTVQGWASPDQLATRVVSSLYQQFEATPRPGWVRGHRPEPAGDRDTDVLTQSAIAPRPSREPHRPERDLRVAADAVLALPAIAPDARVDGTPEFIRAEHAERLLAIEERMVPLLAATGVIISTDEGRSDREWQELIPKLAPNPRMSGSTDLINLRRAPGVLLFHFAGCACAAEGRDEVLGRLLSDRVVVDDPFSGEVPAAASLAPNVVYPTQTATRRMYEYLQRVLVEVCSLGRQRSEDAWERWMYLYCVECEYLQSRGISAYPGYPHLRVEDTGVHQRRVTVGRAVLREFGDVGDEHPSLRAGMCGGNYELFAAAAASFESNYTRWADERDWGALPPGGGVLPSGPHYPGDRTGL